MSLSKEQKKDLEHLGEYFRKLEKISTENKIDLDVFMSDYHDENFAVYATEKVSLENKAEKRKSVFEKAGKEKTPKIVAKNQ